MNDPPISAHRFVESIPAMSQNVPFSQRRGIVISLLFVIPAGHVMPIFGAVPNRPGFQPREGKSVTLRLRPDVTAFGL